jgi:ABC-type multidrug transport system ATPase subunit
LLPRRSRNWSDDVILSRARLLDAGREERVSALRIELLATELIGPISLDIAAGECVALMGPSGVGKSLLLRAIVDLDPNTGNVAVGDRERGEIPASEWRKLVAFVPAESGWWADRVGDHFSAGCNATELIGRLGLAGSLDWDVARLSTGERQRLALARALCRRPLALLLDEPTASLDEHATGLVEQLIRECCGDGMAVLLVTHDRPQAARLAKRVLRMSEGRIDKLSEGVP